MTANNLSVPQATKFVSRLRVLERVTLSSVEQVGNERIAKFSFVSRKGEKRNLYAEFFSRGNLILQHKNLENSDTIIDVENPQTFRHRSLVEGEKYILPPSRGFASRSRFSKNSSLFTRWQIMMFNLSRLSDGLVEP